MSRSILVTTGSIKKLIRLSSIIMQGSSPFAYQSPSHHSSSYLPKMEANFMRDFSCCGLTLPSLHELLQHYEEQHIQQVTESLQKSLFAPSNSKAGIPPGAATGQERAQQEILKNATFTSGHEIKVPPTASRPVTPRTTKLSLHRSTIEPTPSNIQLSHDMDAVQDMEIDDVTLAPSTDLQSQYPIHNQPRMMQRSHFGQPPSARLPPLDMDVLNMGNHLPHQGLRKSQPTTPINSGRRGNLYQNNPTVSSVNTPTLSAHPLHQQQYLNTPDSSAPGTPGELSSDLVGDYGHMSMGNNQQMMQSQYQSFMCYGSANANETPDLYIDDPAKRLFSPDGGLKTPKQASSKLGDDLYAENSELAITIREEQRIAGVTEHQIEGAQPKPFHCPVIGCEKAYKNHNGLKYHKSVSTSPSLTFAWTEKGPLKHGHNTQQLAANDNGTFSIVDPETLSPYPGTLGMEKHKPYRCGVCGKRYKNLNGLKYHKNHSAVCETDSPEKSDLNPNKAASSSSPMPPSMDIDQDMIL